jgi:hypothetical protein
LLPTVILTAFLWNTAQISEIRPRSMKLNKNFAKQAGIFLLFLIGFWALSAIYLSPAIGGEKVLRQGDMQQVRLMRYEADSFKLTHGSYPGWTDGLFGGMPTSLITGIPTGNFVYQTGIAELFSLVRAPFNFLFIAMASMFILLMSAGVNRWLAAAGGIGYAFMTFSITSYEAGHITKVLAMDAMPGVLAGLVLLSRKNYLWGAAVLGMFFTLLVGFFHYQIAYYMGIIVGIYVVVEVIRNLRIGEIRHALILGGIATAAMLAGAASNIGKIIDTQEYAKATMRGGSEVASELPKNGPKNQQQVAKKGLEIDYAFSWSYSPEETFTLLVPRYMGGSSGESIGENEITNDDSRLPLYHGELTFTSGPVYIGAVFIALFILAIVVILNLSVTVPGKYSMAKGIMWFSIITVAVSIILGFGRFFSLNEFLFNNLPYYNKFRTPMMALTIAQVIIPFFGLYGLQLLLNAETTSDNLKKILKNASIAVGSLMAIAAIMIMSNDFDSPRDKGLQSQGWPADAISKLQELRSSAAWGDWLRSLALAAVAIGLIYLHTIRKQSRNLLYVGMIVLITLDLVGVSKRYLSDENWEDKEVEEAIMPSQKDFELMKFNKTYARVFDLRYDPFQDAHSSPWHRNIGGYHPAKLSRYQDIISFCITPNGASMSFETLMKNNALDMLNCGYILTPSQDRTKEEVIPRPTALGNAWFVSKLVDASNAKAAVEMVNKFDPRSEAILEAAEKVKPSAKSWSKDSNSSITISRYSLDTITYKVNNSQNGFAVFSEVYYNEKNAGWKAYADGKEVPIVRVNYILRGAEIPANTKEIKMVFNKQINRYLGVEQASSGMVMLLLAFALGLAAIKKEEPVKGDA